MTDTSGIFFGGLSRGISKGREEDIARRTQDLSEQKFQNQQQQDLLARTDAALNQNAEFLGNTILRLRAEGTDPDSVRGTVAPIAEELRSLMVAAGRDPKVVDPIVEGFLAQASRSELAAQEEQGRDPLKDLTPAEKALDKAFAKELNDFNLRGGFADVQKGLEQLRSARNDLEDAVRSGSGSAAISGPIVGPVEKVAEEVGTSVFKKARSVRETVAEVVQRNLKLILGAQFSKKEGEQLIARAFNPALQEEDNLIRVDRLIRSIETAVQQKLLALEHFDENGTLRGFTGQIPTFEQFSQAVKGAKRQGRLRFNPATQQLEPVGGEE
jgi:hypothetical protein